LSSYEMVEKSSELQALAKDLLSEKVVAIDTEADSFYHYFDKTCLVQIATKKKSFLVDPLAMGGPAKLAPLGPVIASPDVRVIFHAAEYDIFILKRDCGFRFVNLFDTMISAQLLGYPAVGLAALIEHHFDTKVPKDEQRSDWSRRPLSDKQLTYAQSDVHYLIRLADILERELKKSGRSSWARDEFEAVCKRKWPERTFDELGYLRIKGARKLDPQALAALRQIFLVRDARAREIDRPPFKVLGNRTLLEIAEKRPEKLSDLGHVKGVTDLILRRMGRDLLDAIDEGRKEAHGPLPRLETNNRRRIDRQTERVLATLKNWRTVRAEELTLDPGVLCPNASLEAIAWANPQRPADLAKIPELKTWFAREFADEICAVVADLGDAPERPAGSSRSGRSRNRGRGRSGGEDKPEVTQPEHAVPVEDPQK
jgi:ribonuclease D